MKKLLMVILILCSLLIGAAAMAEDIPAAVLEPLTERLDAGYVITAHYYHPGNSRAYFVLSRDGRNQLAIVHEEDGVYELELLATNALRQGDEIPVLETDDDYYIGVFYRHEDGTEDSYTYHLESSGKWMLYAYSFGMGEDSWRSFGAKAGRLTYRYFENNEKAQEITIYGEYQRELKYLDIAALPTTLQEAREKLSQPPAIPDGTLTAKEVKFTSGKKFAVYSGPGEGYVRSANGKASVSTNDWIQVFGTEDGWVLIQYDITSDQMRFGYIDASALPKNANVYELGFAPADAYLTRRVSLTDDPLYSQSALVTLPEGTWVSWLATMGEWAYVESSTGDLVRGFVPLSALTTHRVFDLASQRYGMNAAVLSGTLTVKPDGVITVTVDGWTTRDGQSPLRFEVYNETTMEIIGVAALDTTGTYRGTGYMPGGWSVLICPVWTDGETDVATGLSVQW